MSTKRDESQLPLSQTRRSALKKMLVGTGVAVVALPSRWTKPVIDRVLVPAHAQTSQDPCSYFVYCDFAGNEQERSLQLEIWGDYKCPDDVLPPVSPEGIMVNITTLESNPPNWPCPGNTSVPLDSNGDAIVTVWPCPDADEGQKPPAIYYLKVRVEFKDQTRWGEHSSTCELTVET